MAFSIKNPEADRLARELSALTGETLTEAVINALKERLERRRQSRSAARLRDELMRLGKRCADLPLKDRRTPEEILGYDEDGLPH